VEFVEIRHVPSICCVDPLASLRTRRLRDYFQREILGYLGQVSKSRSRIVEDDPRSSAVVPVDRALSVSVGQHEGEANDYYFRDSFDHSSSESQLLDASGKPHSRSVTPVPRMQNSKLCLQQQQQQQQQHQHHRHHQNRRSYGKLRHKSLHVVRLFIPAFMLIITVLFIVTVLVFETDTTLFNSLRKTPEMVALRSQYYVPIKEFLRTKLGLF